MKKAILTLVAIAATATGMKAQGLTATLQQGDKMTPFYGEDAFVNAYKAAQKGAVITLSAGEFNTVDSITKQVTIIGNGAWNHDGTNRTYIRNRQIKHHGTTWWTTLIINASNVKVEGVNMNYVFLRNVENTRLSHCYIYELYATNPHENTVIDQCYLTYDYSLPRSVNTCYKNSAIYYFKSNNTSANMAYFSNCYIPRWYYYAHVSSSKTFLIGDVSYCPYGVYKNCLLGQLYYLYTQSGSSYWKGNYANVNGINSPSEYYNNVFFHYPYRYYQSGSNWSIEFSDELSTREIALTWGETQTAKGNMVSTWRELVNEEYSGWWNMFKSDLPYKGDDGTQVGINGGTGFSVNPSIPRIVESKIDSNTDAGGRLNVKIKVEVNK